MLMVHGACVDGSSWEKVIRVLQAHTTPEIESDRTPLAGALVHCMTTRTAESGHYTAAAWKKLHQPFGLTSPRTSLQETGVM